MRRFVLAAFFAAFVFGYVIAGPGSGPVSVWRGLGVAIALTAIGAAVARWKAPRYGALTMTVFAMMILIGRAA